MTFMKRYKRSIKEYMKNLSNISGKAKKTMICVLLFIILLLFAIPLYKISYDSIKTLVYSEVTEDIKRIADTIDNEIIMCDEIKNELRTDARYSIIKNTGAVDTLNKYSTLRDFSADFRGRANMMHSNDNVYIIFKNNNIAINKNDTFDNIEPYFSAYFNYDDMDYNEFRNAVFSPELSIRVKYAENLEIEGEKKPSLLIFHPVDSNIRKPPETIIFEIYTIDNLFGKVGGIDFREMLSSIEINDEAIYKSSKDVEKDDDKLIAICKNVGLKICVTVSDDYFVKSTRGFRLFICIYIAVLLIAAIILQIFIELYARRPVRNMLRLVSNIVGDGEIGSEKLMYEKINELQKNKTSYEKSFLLTLFLKPLDSEDAAFIKRRYTNFRKPFFMTVFHGKALTENILCLLMEKFDIEWNIVLSPRKNEFVVIFDYSDSFDMRGFRTHLDNMIFSTKKNGVNITALVGIPCEKIEDFYMMYSKLKNYYRIVDYNGAFVLGEANREKRNAAIGMAKSTKLYELIMANQPFEAKKIIYEQWYNIMVNEQTDNGEIEKLFFSQKGVLSEVALNVNYKVELTKYDVNAKITDLAFSIADDIDAICDFIGSRNAQNDEYQRILEFVDKNFMKMNFGIPDAEAEFGITGKTVNKMVKAGTGKTFTEYVEAHRLNLAKELLSKSTSEVKSIAGECGFQSYDTFYKFFKKHTGVSPAKWRQSRLSDGGMTPDHKIDI